MVWWMVWLAAKSLLLGPPVCACERATGCEWRCLNVCVHVHAGVRVCTDGPLRAVKPPGCPPTRTADEEHRQVLCVAASGRVEQAEAAHAVRADRRAHALAAAVPVSRIPRVELVARPGGVARMVRISSPGDRRACVRVCGKGGGASRAALSPLLRLPTGVHGPVIRTRPC
jgi:hypothetical protein